MSTQNPVGKTLLVPIVVRADASVYTHRLGPSVVVREPDLFDPIKEDFEVLDVDVVPGQGRVCLDGGLDRGTPANGKPRLSEPLVLPTEESKSGVDIIKN